MADEPRRSGRSTKGQHTKNFDIEPAASKRRKSAGSTQTKGSKHTPTEPTPPATEEDEIIRCICGEYEEEEDVERDMICCDQCSAWQHNDCMGLKFAKGEEPAEYYCEQCRPENHKELLERMARGEKPWEEAAKVRAQQAQERKQKRRKGGKRGRKPRASEAKSEANEPGPESAAATPSRAASQSVHEEQTRTPSAPPPPPQEPAGSQKRKFDDHKADGSQEPGPKPKIRKVSTAAPAHPAAARQSPKQARKPSLPTAPAAQVQQASASPTHGPEVTHRNLPEARSKVVQALAKVFVEQTAKAEQQGSFTIPPGQTKESVGWNLSYAIEQALYTHHCGGSGDTNAAYREQMRTILFNVKHNSSLRDSLLVGSTSPDAISTMSSQDMASQEQRQKDDAIKREAERQHIIVQETGPRIRRTHKGEEIVEADPQLVGTESIFSTAPAHRDKTSEHHSPTSPHAASPTASQRHGSEGFGDARRSPSQTHRPHPIDTSAEGIKRRSSSNFNIQDVWSSVQSPGTHHHEPQFSHTFTEQPAPAGHKVQADAEIDKLLKEDEVESPPYSPQEFHADGSVWRGKVVMNALTEFSASARLVGGADLSGRIPWSHMVPEKIHIDGRIGTQLAITYLCDLQFSHSTDITVLAIPPPDAPDDVVQFNRLFDYFIERNRYGVVTKHPLPAVKDTYIVPVDSGRSKKPEFIELLENNAIEDPTPERLLLVVFVVRAADASSTPSTHQPTPQDLGHSTSRAPVDASPVTATSTQYVQHEPYAMQMSPLQSQPPQFSPRPQSDQPTPAAQEASGIAAASQILGSFISAPAIQQLVRQAPNATASQFRLVAGILAENPAAATDYQVLMTAITQAQNGGTAA